MLEARPDAANESRNAAGLYHTAFLMPTRKDLARWLVHAAINRVPLSGFADHRVSESVYLDDPEGNGIEVYADRDPSLWQWSGDTVTMGTDQLDIDDLVSLTDTSVSDYAGAPEGLRIGHMHLRVGDLAKAEGFYRGTHRLRSDARAQRRRVPRPPAAIITISVSTSGRAPAPAAATMRPPALPGSRWISRRPDLFAAMEERLRKAGAEIAVQADGDRGRRPLGHAGAARQGLTLLTPRSRSSPPRRDKTPRSVSARGPASAKSTWYTPKRFSKPKIHSKLSIRLQRK